MSQDPRVPSNVEYSLPDPQSFLRMVMENILYNFAKGETAELDIPPSVSRAYAMVNETATMPVRVYSVNDTLIK